MKEYAVRRLVVALCATGMISISAQAIASGFQLWEQDGASVGNYHAGYAAALNDASATWYNPAGILRIHNQQVVVGASGVRTDFKYKGNVTVSEYNALFQETMSQTFSGVTAQGGEYNGVPNLDYVAPISDDWGFGFSVDVPFGLETNYGSSTPLRYASTLTSITVVDISPALAYRLADKASFGAGFDIQRASAEFNSVATIVNGDEVDTSTDTTSKNSANDTGYGYHLGFLYEFTPTTRAGISYHSQVVHHLTGKSKFEGPIAVIVNEDNANELVSDHAKAKITLPPYTALSLYHDVTPCWAVMGSVVYTEWSTIQNLVLNGVAGAVSDPDTLLAPSTDIQVILPEHYVNTWNLSVGTEYRPSQTVLLRGGVGYDQSPVRNAYRNVQLPDNDRYAVALGAHYQASKIIGLDVGWSHFFLKSSDIHPPAQVVGPEVVTTNGHVTGSADVLSGQVTWDIT